MEAGSEISNKETVNFSRDFRAVQINQRFRFQPLR